MPWCCSAFSFAFSSLLTSLVSFWPEMRTEREQEWIWPPEGRSLHKRFPPCRLCLHQGPGHCRIISIWYATSYWPSMLLERQFCVKPPPPPCELCFWNVTHLGSEVTAEELLLGRGREGLKTRLSVLRLTTVAILLQVNFERRHPSFTRSLKRNAKWRTVRRPME